MKGRERGTEDEDPERPDDTEGCDDPTVGHGARAMSASTATPWSHSVADRYRRLFHVHSLSARASAHQDYTRGTRKIRRLRARDATGGYPISIRQGGPSR